jgi:hypothetical protein
MDSALQFSLWQSTDIIPLDSIVKCENIKILILSIAAAEFYWQSHIIMMLTGY